MEITSKTPKRCRVGQYAQTSKEGALSAVKELVLAVQRYHCFRAICDVRMYTSGITGKCEGIVYENMGSERCRVCKMWMFYENVAKKRGQTGYE